MSVLDSDKLGFKVWHYTMLIFLLLEWLISQMTNQILNFFGGQHN